MKPRTMITASLAMALTLLGSGAAHAGTPYVFNIRPGGICLRGTGPSETALTIRLRNASGDLLDRVDGSIDEFGEFQLCFEVLIQPGYRLIARGAAPTRSVIVPVLSVSLDRVNNRIRGKVPAGTDLDVGMRTCTPRMCPPPTMFQFSDLPASFTRNLTGVDVDGADYAEVSYLTPAGDTIAIEELAPYMTIREGGPNALQIQAIKPGPVTFELRTTGGTLLARAARNLPTRGGYTLRFRKNGNPVPITAGRKVIGDFAADADIRVPSLGLSFDTSADTVSGTCFEGYDYALDARVGGSATGYQGTAGPGGAYTQSVPDLDSGWIIEVICENQRGDRLRVRGKVP